MNNLKEIIKATLFISGEGVATEDIMSKLEVDKKTFNKALDVFNEICKNCSDSDIRSASNYITESIVTVRDAKQLLRSIKMRNARSKNATKVTAKIAKKIEDINKANERKIQDIQSKLQSKINVAATGSSGTNDSPDIDGAELDNN